MSDAAKRMEGAPDTSASGQKCALAGKHKCGGPVSRSWGDCWMCSVGWLVFSEADHNDTPHRVREWIRIKGGTP